MNSNPKDPLRNWGPDAERTLFELFGKIAGGSGIVVDAHAAAFPSDAAIGAACNILINALRQVHPNRESAERAFDELFGRTKQLLMNHYDQLGRKRGIFPFDQVISVDAFLDSDRDHRH